MSLRSDVSTLPQMVRGHARGAHACGQGFSGAGRAGCSRCRPCRPRPSPRSRRRRAPDPHRRGAPRRGRGTAGADAHRGVPLREARGRVLAASSLAAGVRCRRSTTRRWTATPCAPPTSPARRTTPRSRSRWPPTSRRAARTRPRSRPGPPHRIMTGAPVPVGGGRGRAGRAHRRRRRARARVPRAGGRARHVRRAGEDVAAGAVVLAGGHGAGARRRSASRPRSARPRCRCAAARWCSCSPRGPSWSRRARRCGRARSTSRTGRCWWRPSSDAGGVGELLRFVPDDVAQFLRRARRAARPGRRSRDHLRRDERGRLRGRQGGAGRPRASSSSRWRCSRAARRAPGRVDGGVPVVTLPGNPVSSQVSFEVFVRPGAARRARATPIPSGRGSPPRWRRR